MSKPAAAFLVVALLTPAFSARGQDATYYVPFVKVRTTLNPFESDAFYITQWLTTLSAFNNSPIPGSVTYKAVNGPGYVLLGPDRGCPRPYPLNPFAGDKLESLGGGCIDFQGDHGPAFLELTASRDVVVSADVQRVLSIEHCGGTTDPNGYNDQSQGVIPLPIYRGLFPAGSKTATGPIDLGIFDDPFTCLTGSRRHVRRVDVALFNAGEQSATFTIIARRLRYYSDILYQTAVVLAPKEVRQLNSIPIPFNVDQWTIDGNNVRIWLNITADQPFLSYASAIFEGGEPGTNAVTIYESRMAN